MPSLKGIIEVQSGLGLGFFCSLWVVFSNLMTAPGIESHSKIMQSSFFEKYLKMWCKRRRMESHTEEMSSSTAVSVKSAH